jgi:hypothetical protein
MKVILHDSECKIQISGCLCSEVENHGEEHARQRMLDRGIWMPEWGPKPAGKTLLGADGKPLAGRLHG